MGWDGSGDGWEQDRAGCDALAMDGDSMGQDVMGVAMAVAMDGSGIGSDVMQELVGWDVR